MRLDSRTGRVVQRMAGSPSFARVAPKVVPPLDRALNKVSGGRMMLSDALVPGIVLVTTGAKTGQPRETPLAAMPADGGFFVVGSNFGKPTHPAWTANLLRNPRAVVRHKGAETDVVARLLDDDERADTWPRMLAVWPPYASYAQRTHRELRIFHLAPAR